MGIREDKPPQNLSPYALSKYDAERLSMDYGYALGLPVVAFRYFNVYGPRQSLSNPYTGVLAIFLSRLRNGNPPVVFEDGRQMRDFVYVEDVAKMNLRALSQGEGVYNLGSGKPMSLLRILREIQLGIATDIEPRVTGDFRVGDTRHDFANISHLERDFGTAGFRSFAMGLKPTLVWSSGVEARDYFERQEKERLRHLN